MNTKNFSLSAILTFLALFAVMGTSFAYSSGEIERKPAYHANPVVVTQDDGTQCIQKSAATKKIKALKRQAKKDLRQKKRDARTKYRADMKAARGDNTARKAIRKEYRQTRKDLRNEKRAMRKVKTLAGYKLKGYLKDTDITLCK